MDAKWSDSIGFPLVQATVWYLFNDEECPLSKSDMKYCQLNPKELISVKFESKYTDSRDKNSFEYPVCNMESILFRPQCVKWNVLWHADQMSQKNIAKLSNIVDRS